MFKLAAALMLSLSSLGQTEPVSFAPKGVFLFHTNAQQDDRPVCSELWEFTDDGHMLIESGAERVRASYRIERDRDGVWIVRRLISTNGEPDCMGHRNPEPSKEETRTYVVPMNDGRVMTCPAPSRTEDGAPFVSNCYGWLVPADQAG